jgi:phosphoribosylformylglycinamidine (FGAM) synthase-like amidotransferase family enzyme
MVAIGSAKSWDITVHSATKAGSTVLPAGEYRVKLDNNQATFTETGSGKQFTVAVKVQQGDHKFDATATETVKQGDTDVIQHIDLGGTTEELQFGE